MDSALLLRKKRDMGVAMTHAEIDSLLAESKVVQKLTRDYEDTAFFSIFRILCLAEVPYAERLPYTKRLIAAVSENLATPEGFSYTGLAEDIVPCYNAMLLEAFTQLGLVSSPEAQNALAWIKSYQIFDRNQSTAWSGSGICKHGGCMRAVPCYIGIGKTVRALITYAEATGHNDKTVDAMIRHGTDYMLRHSMFLRLSDKRPISAHITDIMFPQAYMLSLTDLVYIVSMQGLWQDPRTQSLKRLLREKAISPGSWKIDYIYSHKGYKAFETRRNPSEWIGYLFSPVVKVL